MQILLNDLLTLSAQPRVSPFYITGVTGLGIADIRTSSFLFSGRDGGLVTDQLLGFRNININGKIGSDDVFQHQLDRQEMSASLPVGTVFPVYFTLFDGSIYRIDCSLANLTIDYNPGGYTSDFLIQLLAADPFFYSVSAGDEQSVTIPKSAQGGYVTPYILPVIWELGGAPTIVLNSGTAVYYPTITLNNEALNPTVANQLTGETFSLNLSMLDGDEVIIDMKNRTVTLNGSDILGNKTDDSVWWGLLPGDNPVLLDTDTADDPVTATLTWRNAVTGI